jgi:hypothetical protein
LAAVLVYGTLARLHWPWDIEHSLAVLWGVCWMFFFWTKTESTLGHQTFAYYSQGCLLNVLWPEKETWQQAHKSETGPEKRNLNLVIQARSYRGVNTR